MAEISDFSGPFRFLSNFYIEPDGTHVEGEYQAAKCITPADRRQFDGISPLQAKHKGKKVMLRPGWDLAKLDIMKKLVTKKFKDHPELAKKLLDTGDDVLVEGNVWGDTFWGIHNGHGHNHLGRLLMEIREGMRGK